MTTEPRERMRETEPSWKPDHDAESARMEAFVQLVALAFVVAGAVVLWAVTRGWS